MGVNLNYAIPGVGDAGPGWASKVITALQNVEAAARVSAVAYGADPSHTNDSTAAINNAVAACPAGGELYLPTGNYRVNVAGGPTLAPITKAIRIVGDGPWASWITPEVDAAAPVIYFNLPSSSPTNLGYYGASVENIGLDLYGTPSATGIRLNQYTSWTRLDHVMVSGGAISVSNAGANSRFADLDLIDGGVFIHVDADTGLELRLTNIQMSRNTAGTTTRCIEVIAATFTANKGALRMTKVSQSGGSSGGIQTNAGLYVSAPAPAAGVAPCSLPVFAEDCEFDNITGGGPGLEFVHVADINFHDGWVNCGVASGGPAVRITGGDRLRFTSNTYFGGGSGIGVNKTYDFVGGGGGTANTNMVTSKDNTCPTNWVYYLPASNGPAVLDVDDRVPGATGGFAVSNDMTQLATVTTAALHYGSKTISDKLAVRQPVLPDGVSSFFTTLVNGVSPAVAAVNASSTLSHIVAYYYTPSGTMGILRPSAITSGTSFVITSYTTAGAVNTLDQSTIGVLLINRG